MSSDQPLFDVAFVERLQPGDDVVLQTIWGDEPATVVRVKKVDGFPVVQLEVAGDTIYVDAARVKREDS